MVTAWSFNGSAARTIWMLNALNTLVGLVFIGFLVWLVTESLREN
jgi:hypothetical protein